MDKTEGYTEICFNDVGTAPNGTEKRVQVFLLKNSSKKNRKNPKKNEKRQKTSRDERNRRILYGNIYFKLQPGQRYRIEETIRKKRKTARWGCVVDVEQNGNIIIKNLEERICPQFSSTKEVISQLPSFFGKMIYMLIDTHAHINFSSFDKDREQVIQKCLSNNLWMINVGTNLKTSEEVINIAQKYTQGIYASIGLHPINLNTGLVKIKFDENEGKHLEQDFDFNQYKKLAQSEKVVAIGEIGLDYYWKPKTTGRKQRFFQLQKDLLLEQLELAKQLNLPVIFHCRMAHDDLIKILNTNYLKGVIHCFTGNWEQAQEYMDLGLYLGFNGIIFKLNLDQIIKKTPLERILIETDCPYLPPPKFKGQRNEPLYIKYIAQRIAEIKGIDLETVSKITTQNAKTLFNLG